MATTTYWSFNYNETILYLNGEPTGSGSSYSEYIQGYITGDIDAQRKIKSVVFEGECALAFDHHCAHMFEHCENLVSIDNLSYFDISNTEDTSSMFAGCSSLTSLDLSNFNTSKVIDMKNMFSGCSSLQSLDLSSFNTSNVIYMECMFNGCSSLKTLNVSSFDTSKVMSMYQMFSSCSSLETLDLSNFNFINSYNSWFMFAGCSSLASLNLLRFSMSETHDIHNMFSECYNLQKITAGDWIEQARPSSSSDMFYNCISLPNFDPNNIGFNRAYDCRGGGYFNGSLYKIAYNNKIIKDSDKIKRNYYNIKCVYRKNIRYWGKI